MSQEEPDPTANTEKFRAFVESDEPAKSGRSGVSRGMIAVLVGVVAVVIVIALALVAG